MHSGQRHGRNSRANCWSFPSLVTNTYRSWAVASPRYAPRTHQAGRLRGGRKPQRRPRASACGPGPEGPCCCCRLLLLRQPGSLGCWLLLPQLAELRCGLRPCHHAHLRNASDVSVSATQHATTMQSITYSSCMHNCALHTMMYTKPQAALSACGVLYTCLSGDHSGKLRISCNPGLSRTLHRPLRRLHGQACAARDQKWQSALVHLRRASQGAPAPSRAALAAAAVLVAAAGDTCRGVPLAGGTLNTACHTSLVLCDAEMPTGPCHFRQPRALEPRINSRLCCSSGPADSAPELA